MYLALFLAFLCVILFSYFRILDNYELETLDIRFRLRPDLPVDKNIAIIEIADDTLDKLGLWPISRKYHAALVEALSAAGARAIVFDIFFSEESDEEADRIFAEAIKKSGRVYLPYVFSDARDKLQEDILAEFKDSAKGTGLINAVPDTDGKFRRVPAFIEYEGARYPHISFAVAADYPGIEKGALKVPLNSDSTINVNFPGRWEDTFRHYSYIDVIDSHIRGEFPAILGKKADLDLTALKGSVCFVGITATGALDAHPSPVDALYPGVGVHASVFNSLLQGKFIERVGRLLNILILIFLCFITYLISARAKRIFGFILIFIFVTGYIAASAASFILWGLWLDIFYPVIVIFLLYLALTFAKYIGEMHKREILERELDIAKKIQESFLPREKPEVAGIGISARMITARQVGGDLYDFVKMEEGRFGVMIGDVAGKGVPAALYMAKAVSEFKSTVGDVSAGYASARQAIAGLNDRLCRESTSGLFVTVSYVIFDTKESLASISSGGHLPVLAVKGVSFEARMVDVKEGMPLGLFEGEFGEERIPFGKGDTFVLYTDGVTEAMNRRGEMFGEERLVGLVKDNGSLNAEGLATLIQSEVKKFEGRRKQHDDITVIVVRT